MPNINTILDQHVVFQCECIDRLYLNAYIPILQLPCHLVNFLIKHLDPSPPQSNSRLAQAWHRFDQALDSFIHDARLAPLTKLDSFVNFWPTQAGLVNAFVLVTNRGTPRCSISYHFLTLHRLPASGWRTFLEFDKLNTKAAGALGKYHTLITVLKTEFVKACRSHIHLIADLDALGT